MFKYLIVLLLSSLLFFSNIFAKTGEYIYFYGKTCSNCIQLDKFFRENNIYNKYNIIKKEVYFNETNRQELLKRGKELGYSLTDIKVPFFIDVNKGVAYNKLSDIVNIFYEGKNIKQFDKNTNSSCDINGKTCSIKELNKTNNDNFLFILIPAAISDSINPCAFAVLLILLSTILSRYKDRKKAIYAGLSFTLSIFIAYYLMGLGIYKLLGLLNFSKYESIVKIIIGFLGILVGILNIKDYFAYGKWFVMEVPFSWRENMKKIIKKATSPVGAFMVGLIVSLFLLPCTSGPYFVVLGFLSASSMLTVVKGYLYLLLYNIIFILPMLFITFIIGLGLKNIDELKEIREFNVEKIHLVIGILMILVGAYILYEALFFI